MRFKIPALTLVVVLLLFGLSTGSPAETRRVIQIVMTSYKFDPDLFFVNEGDTVVLQLENADTTNKRPHTFSSPYLSRVDFTVSGQSAQGMTPDGNKYVRLEPGQKAELTFVAKGTGQYGFICSIAGPGFNHAARGQTGAFVVWPAGYHPKR